MTFKEYLQSEIVMAKLDKSPEGVAVLKTLEKVSGMLDVLNNQPVQKAATNRSSLNPTILVNGRRYLMTEMSYQKPIKEITFQEVKKGVFVVRQVFLTNSNPICRIDGYSDEYFFDLIEI